MERHITVASRPMSGSAPIGNFLGTPKRRTHLGIQFSHFTVMDSKLFIPACIHANDETRDRVLLSTMVARRESMTVPFAT